MYLMIRFEAGVVVDAVVLARGENTLRVAISGMGDVIELTQFGQRWYTELGEAVQFDCCVSLSQASEPVVARALTFAAGRAAV